MIICRTEWSRPGSCSSSFGRRDGETDPYKGLSDQYPFQNGVPDPASHADLSHLQLRCMLMCSMSCIFLHTYLLETR